MNEGEHRLEPGQSIDAINPPITLLGRLRSVWPSLLMIGSTLMLTIALLLFVPREAVAQLGSLGYVGIFFLTMVSSASLFLPSPVLATTFIAGQALDPSLVGVAAGIGAGIGESTGYLAGYGGSNMIQGSRYYPRVENWVRRWGVVTIFILAMIPSPLIDVAGIAAGTIRMNYWVYLTSCCAGKIVRFLIYAWAGYLLGSL